MVSPGLCKSKGTKTSSPATGKPRVKIITGELLTRGTVWLALSLYVASQMLTAGRPVSRWFNALGCAAFLAHVLCAFHFYHGWSHSAAYVDTARQAANLVGWRFGAGLYVNYFFAVIWVGEVASGWVARPKWITWTVRAFFWFMIFNGAVVFAHGPMRLYGLLLSLALAAIWWRSTSGNHCK